MRKWDFPYLNEYVRGSWLSGFLWNICFVLGWIALEPHETWVLPCGNSLFCVNSRYAQNWCGLKDPITAFLDVYIQIACGDVIIGCIGRAVIVRLLIDLRSPFFCRCVTNTAPVLTHRICIVGQGVASVGGSPAGNARAVCVPASGSGWAIAFSSLGVLICISLFHSASSFFHATCKNIITLRPLPFLKIELKFASRFRSF